MLDRSAMQTLFSALVHTSPQPMLITNEAVEIQYVNPAWEKQFGYLLREVEGRNPRILKSGRTDPAIHREMWRTLRSGRPFQTSSVVDRRKDGTVFNVRSTIFHVSIGTDLYYVQILDDISEERRRTQFQSLFIRTAAHDLRSPLHALQLMSDHALLERPDPRVRALQAEIKHISALANTLLDARQYDAGQIVLDRKMFDLTAAIVQVADEARVRTRNIVLKAPPQLIVFADVQRIQQVILNLVDNAIKYAASGPVDITVADHGDRVTVSVTDTGSGISESDQRHLFELNFRTRAAHASVIDGSGLGLYTARDIMRAHGGDITVHSTPGSGTTFIAALPK